MANQSNGKNRGGHNTSRDKDKDSKNTRQGKQK